MDSCELLLFIWIRICVNKNRVWGISSTILIIGCNVSIIRKSTDDVMKNNEDNLINKRITADNYSSILAEKKFRDNEEHIWIALYSLRQIFGNIKTNEWRRNDIVYEKHLNDNTNRTSFESYEITKKLLGLLLLSVWSFFFFFIVVRSTYLLDLSKYTVLLGEY